MLKISFKDNEIDLTIEMENESVETVMSAMRLINTLALDKSTSLSVSEAKAQETLSDDGVLESSSLLNRENIKITYGVIDEDFIESHPELNFVDFYGYSSDLEKINGGLALDEEYYSYYDTGVKYDEDDQLRFKTRYFCYKCGNKGFHYIPEETETVSCHVCAASLVVFPVTSTLLVRNDMGYYFVAGSSSMNISEKLQTPHETQFIF